MNANKIRYLALLLVALLAFPALAETKCAPNGTCWRVEKPQKNARLIWVDDLAGVRHLCKPSLRSAWRFSGSASILACTVGINLPQPFIILPKKLPARFIEQGWTVELLAEYEQANADKRTDYSNNKISLKR